MRNLIISILILFVGCAISMRISAQTPSNDEVTLISSGEGTTKDEAIKGALLNAIEQTYGTFVSAKTTILNDEIIKDEIVTISSGNVLSYDIISENKNGNEYNVTIKAIISIGRLASFVKSKGGEAELAGANFAMNVKLDKFYKWNEGIAFNHLREELKQIIPTMFDYNIEIGEPVETNNGMYEVDGKVLVYANENAMIFMNKFVQFFEAISLSPNEMDKRGGWITYIYFPEFTYSGGNRNSDSNSFYRLAKSNNKEVVHFFRNIEPLETQGLYGIVVKELSNFTINDGINTYSIKEIYKDGDYIIVHPRKGENNNMYFESSKIGYGGKDKLDDSNFIHLETNGANRYAFPVKGLVASFPFSLFYTLDELSRISKITVSPTNTK